MLQDNAITTQKSTAALIKYFDLLVQRLFEGSTYLGVALI